MFGTYHLIVACGDPGEISHCRVIVLWAKPFTSSIGNNTVGALPTKNQKSNKI